MDLQQAPLQNSRTCPPSLTQRRASWLHRNFATLEQSSTLTFPLVTAPTHPDQRTGRQTLATMPTIAVDKYALYEALGQK